jgi:hypothetical protein
MRRLTLHMVLACATAAAVPGLVAAPAALAPVTTSAAAVTVKVTPRPFGATWDFDVVFDTHSQDLTDDLLKTAVLLGPDGSELRPIEWKGAAPGGHHRTGVLRFAAPNPAPTAVVLRITRPGEPKPRVFQWKLP